jgi:hypothetical protein
MHIFFNFIFAAVSDSTSDDLGDKTSSVQFKESLQNVESLAMQFLRDCEPASGHRVPKL